MEPITAPTCYYTGQLPAYLKCQVDAAISRSQLLVQGERPHFDWEQKHSCMSDEGDGVTENLKEDRLNFQVNENHPTTETMTKTA